MTVELKFGKFVLLRIVFAEKQGTQGVGPKFRQGCRSQAKTRQQSNSKVKTKLKDFCG